LLADRFLQKRYAAGHAEGQSEGRAERQKEWEAWNERRQEAEAKCQTFDEPPPNLKKQT
jgi:flagellar biosynthesis/type III secretory pathway protein FliH